MDADMLFTEPDRCNHLSTPSMPQFVISCVLMGWVLVSYIPQYARIISRKSAEGLSTLYILLGSLSGVCAVGNIMMLPSSEVEIGCCRELQRFACISGLLGMFQVMFGIACFWGVLFMYVYYAEEEAEAEMHHRRASLSGPERTFRRARKAYLVLLCACGFAFAIMLVSAIISHRFPWYSKTWADTLGVAVAVLACVQWVPQTLTTWHLGHLGSLSLASLCLSAPYTWIFGINMIMRVGLSGWSAWVVYILVGTMQIILIAMGISFKVTGETQPHEQRRPSIIAMHFDGWNASHRSVASSNVAPDERRPLLAGSPMRHASDGLSASRSRGPGGGERRQLMSMSPPPHHSRDGRAAADSPAGR